MFVAVFRISHKEIINNADRLATRYESISYSQAKAVIYKEIGLKMDTNHRTQLYKLRKKIKKYKPLVDNFNYLISREENVINELQSKTY